jgi:hypothetical protein
MRSEQDIKRYMKILSKKASVNLEAYNMIRALGWVLDDGAYPVERDLTILEETYKERV